MMNAECCPLLVQTVIYLPVRISNGFWIIHRHREDSVPTNSPVNASKTSSAPSGPGWFTTTKPPLIIHCHSEGNRRPQVLTSPVLSHSWFLFCGRCVTVVTTGVLFRTQHGVTLHLLMYDTQVRLCCVSKFTHITLTVSYLINSFKHIDTSAGLIITPPHMKLGYATGDSLKDDAHSALSSLLKFFMWCQSPRLRHELSNRNVQQWLSNSAEPQQQLLQSHLLCYNAAI